MIHDGPDAESAADTGGPQRGTRRSWSPGAIAKLVELTGDRPVQHRRALAITRDIRRYFSIYSVGIVNFLQRNPQAAPSVATDARGRTKVEAIRRQFKRFLETETEL